MEQALEKIRPHTSSSLPHQSTPANLLIALELTLKERKTEASKEASPTAYFALLCTTLDGTLRKQAQGSEETQVLHAELYLLALIAPFVPTPVIQANLQTLLSLTAPLFSSLQAHAPALRSQLSVYHIVFRALDRSQLEIQGIRQTFATILQLCIDHRPKVRKKAAELIKDVLDAPPTPLARHPYAERVADWLKNALTDVSTAVFPKSKSSKVVESRPETSIRIIAFLRLIIASLPPSSGPSITNLLLTFPRFGNPYLTRSVYLTLADLLSLPFEDDTYDHNHLSDVFKAVLTSAPAMTDITLSSTWVQLLGTAFSKYTRSGENIDTNELNKAWNALWAFLESTDSVTRRAAAESLGLLCHSFSPQLISAAVKSDDSQSVLRKIIGQVEKALGSLAYVRAVPELLSITSALITNLRYRTESDSPTATELLLCPLIKRVGDLRTSKGFEFKEDADRTLAAALRVLGPDVLFRVLPLNLEPSDRRAGREPRAYLLPLLSHPHPSPLNHFVSYFVPLSECMFDLQSRAEAEGRKSEAKVWNVLVAQVWAGLVGYCWGTPDLREALTPQFSQLLTQLLYSQPELRPSVLRALKAMVESNVAIASGKDDQVTNPRSISSAKATENVAFLRSQAENWLAVLFNVFSTIDNSSRVMIGDAIGVWASIAGEQEVAKSYGKVVELFRTNLQNQDLRNTPRDDQGNVISMMQDILIILLPLLCPSNATSLLELCMTPEVLGAKDNSVQKRGYKILRKIIERDVTMVDSRAVIQKLNDLSDGLVPAAKKDRFNLLSLLIRRIPPSGMHIILSLIPEAVLGTKEPSEKTRFAAFELVLAMARKMNKGGVVKRHLVDGMDEDGGLEAAANVEEFLTMLAGGLAASPHMISATVTAMSRVVFEFKDGISHKMHSEIFTTLLVFLTSTNREIVKSILGYVKLAIHSIPSEILAPNLKDLVPALLSWSHDHKNHFKAKVKHIFERMIRRFGWDAVYACAGEEEARKVLVNIKKIKDRAKRKRAQKAQDDGDDGDDDDKKFTAKVTAGDAFEDVLYGSESEDEDESRPQSKDSAHGHVLRLRADDDEPMDLLEGSSSRVTLNASQRRRQPGQVAHFKTEESTGKLIIGDDSSSAEEDEHPAMDVTGVAYQEGLTSIDGFTRGPAGKIKFNKDTKKRRRQVEDVEMGDDEKLSVSETKKAKKRAELKLGYEFKAKKAGGDIKKKGIEPYAYLPLSQAARKGRRGSGAKLGITGKR